jgi:hypothetical protein
MSAEGFGHIRLLAGRVGDEFHCGSELVSAARKRNDVAEVPLFWGNGLPKEEDVLAEISFFNKAVGPDGAKKFLFREEAKRVLNKVQKQVEGLRRECNLFTIASKHPLIRIQIKGAKTIEVVDHQWHSGPEKS